MEKMQFASVKVGDFDRGNPVVLILKIVYI